jgi:hypothetical protein
MIVSKVDLLWDNEPENLQMLNHFFFVVEDMALRRVSLRLLFSPPAPSPLACRIILPLLHDNSFIYHQHHVILAIKSVVK